MYDYFKLRIEEPEQVRKIVSLPFLSYINQMNASTGEVMPYPMVAKDGPFTVEVKSATLVFISGSIHKFWNRGTNENDFFFADAQQAIEKFCRKFELAPELAEVCNLEYGVNINPSICASELIQQVLCLDNIRPNRPYDDKPDRCFIEVPIGEHYIKIYDKGKQYRTKNTLRFEVKAMRSRCLDFANISTLADLLKPETMIALGRKINQVFERVVFTDHTIEPSKLSKSEYKNYMLMKDPNEWAKAKGRKTSTHRNRESRFRQIVEEHGKLKIYSSTLALIKAKVEELTTPKLRIITPIYTGITNQQKTAKFKTRMLVRTQFSKGFRSHYLSGLR